MQKLILPLCVFAIGQSSCGGRVVDDLKGAGGGLPYSSAFTASDDGGAQNTASNGGLGGAGPASQSGSGLAGQGGAEQTPDIEMYLDAVADSYIEEPSQFEGYRYFLINFEQPVDHDNPNGQVFLQRIALYHRDTSLPTVLSSTGYGLYDWAQWLEEPTELLQANQLMVEHRFFSGSRPDPADWSKLNIKQAAADYHDIVDAFRPFYEGHWISTGGSKGGVTALNHRRFFPDDVDGTVAYVAPYSSGTEDPRYVDFLNQVGDAPCRLALGDFQRQLLLRREPMIARMQTQAAEQGQSYDLFGAEAVLEGAAVSLPFSFWQYQKFDLCPEIPTASASDDAVWDFYNKVSNPAGATDFWTLWFEPYDWQAGSELGSPAVDTSGIDDLLTDESFIDAFPSIDGEPSYDPAPSADVRAWLESQGAQLLLIYGGNDPWSAGQIDVAGADSHKFVVPGGNHGSEIQDLGDAERAVALKRLEHWAGAPIRSLARTSFSPRVGSHVRRWRAH